MQKVSVGIVGGSDLTKIKEQLGDNGVQPADSEPSPCAVHLLPNALHRGAYTAILLIDCMPATPRTCTTRGLKRTPQIAVCELVDYTFSENGLMAHKGTELLAVQSLKDYLGEDKLKTFINYVLRYIADLDIPIKRGTFIEFRNGMINISPIGRNCSQEERMAFEQFDKEAKVRCAVAAQSRWVSAQPALRHSWPGHACGKQPQPLWPLSRRSIMALALTLHRPQPQPQPPASC
jgi:Eukaryotic phosphomannomutase